ncbi:helix-turn-helix transcriptional regulator [Patulibacter sp.]|uniref:helix-turn-helix transcriptional regulator n=1 Tax=Patulibacter sp. TaxID=1912859 RepID=UPI0027246B03|nr:helix-turn-helix transcriptional regulator [Patulibacter sp.]MDO9409711.1 helix-turn-helix transcriptional regulator [Patulibacter sp.]
MPRTMLRKYRKAAGLSQVQLAAAIGEGVDPSTVSYWESGDRCPRFVHAMALEDVLGVAATRLLAPAPVNVEGA